MCPEVFRTEIIQSDSKVSAVQGPPRHPARSSVETGESRPRPRPARRPPPRARRATRESGEVRARGRAETADARTYTTVGV